MAATRTALTPVWPFSTALSVAGLTPSPPASTRRLTPRAVRSRRIDAPIAGSCTTGHHLLRLGPVGGRC